MASNWPGIRPSQSSAEILPPESRANPGSYPGGRMAGYDGDPTPLPPRRPVGSRWATAPATYTLVGINCAVYLAMVLRGVSASNPSVQDLVRWGANFGGYVLAGQWWRLLTAAFVHVGILHLATNMWCLWNLGLLGEPLLGPAGLVAVYVLTGIAGNLLSVAVHPQVVGAGASGAVFGLGRPHPVAEGKIAPRAARRSSPAAQERDLLCPVKFCDWRHHDVFPQHHQDRQHGPFGRVSLRSGVRRSAGAPDRLSQEPIRLSLLGSVRRHDCPAAGLRLRHRLVLALKRCLAYCSRSELLDHRQQQLAVAVIQIRRIAADLR
jgi:membrane associated rhomboid family serine protease